MTKTAGAAEPEKTCFVIMGFGRKADYGEPVRTLDLDASYRAIIKPAVIACGYRCIRADEVQHSGVIDQKMYELLLRADLVIADISTANANAIYELGVRHALRPYATIIMKESEGKFHFDLNHLATMQYRHLGEDIGSLEAEVKRDELARLIRSVGAKRETDSPVFTFLAAYGLKPMSDEELQRIFREMEASAETLASVVEKGRAAAADSDHLLARQCFERAVVLQSQSSPLAAGAAPPDPDPFIIQQLALATYKAKDPSELEALKAAWTVIQRLNPDAATDPETLGIAGAIRKRLWLKTDERPHLDAATELYGRGFEVKRDYYNGENYALCLDLRANVQEPESPEEASYDRLTARKVRNKIKELLTAAFADPETPQRPDYKWMLATMANTRYALGDDVHAVEGDSEKKFRDIQPAGWELATFEEGKKYALELAGAARRRAATA